MCVPVPYSKSKPPNIKAVVSFILDRYRKNNGNVIEHLFKNDKREGSSDNGKVSYSLISLLTEIGNQQLENVANYLLDLHYTTSVMIPTKAAVTLTGGYEYDGVAYSIGDLAEVTERYLKNKVYN